MTMMKDDMPRRGEVFLADLDRDRGSSGGRTCLVIQNDHDNQRRNLTIIALLTTDLGSDLPPFIVMIRPDIPELPDRMYVNCGQIYTIFSSRLPRKLGALSPSQMAEVDRGVLQVLGLEGLMTSTGTS